MSIKFFVNTQISLVNVPYMQILFCCHLLVKSEKVKFLVILLSLISFNNCYSQNTFRRHFIIAYDISSPFINAETNCPEYRQALSNLFLNKSVDHYNEAYQDNLGMRTSAHTQDVKNRLQIGQHALRTMARERRYSTRP